MTQDCTSFARENDPGDIHCYDCKQTSDEGYAIIGGAYVCPSCKAEHIRKFTEAHRKFTAERATK